MLGGVCAALAPAIAFGRILALRNVLSGLVELKNHSWGRESVVWQHHTAEVALAPGAALIMLPYDLNHFRTIWSEYAALSQSKLEYFAEGLTYAYGNESEKALLKSCDPRLSSYLAKLNL